MGLEVEQTWISAVGLVRLTPSKSSSDLLPSLLLNGDNSTYIIYGYDNRLRQGLNKIQYLRPQT